MSAVDSPHRLLLRHFEEWARSKGKDVDLDLDLLETLLELRSSYDDLEATYWPLESVNHLLLERWPSKGAVQAPQPDVLVGTLDAFFRFLRRTGRMSSHSADPKALLKEVRRAAARMPDVAADPVTWSPTKVLMDFGRSIGIDVDHVPDVETMQQRLDQIQSAWNALPMEERRRRMPHESDRADSSDDADLSGLERALRRYDLDDPTEALLRTFTSLPTGELPTAAVVGPIFASAPFIQQLLRLADWVGEGREVTSTRVLRPALAHEAHDALGLGSWTRSQLRRRYPDETLPGVAAVGLETWIEQEAERPWSRAADCEALHRLWLAAAASGVVEMTSSSVRASTEPVRDPEDWLQLGVRACIGVMEMVLDRALFASPLVFAMVTSYCRGRGPVTWVEILEFRRTWLRSPSELEIDAGDAWWESYDRAAVDEVFGLLADAGLYLESADGVRLTEAGDVFVSAWLTYLSR